MKVAALIEALQAMPEDTRILVPGLNGGFDETAGPELRTLVAVASDGCQTSMGTWMDLPADGAYPSHPHCTAVVLPRVVAKD